MAEYFITKREKCERCVDGQIGFYSRDTPDAPHQILSCGYCDGLGNINTPVDLLEVLAKVRWTEIGDIITKDGYEKGVVDLRFNNLTIED